MSFLKHKLPTTCPRCNCADIISEIVQTTEHKGKLEIYTHCNGERWETRTFLCGFSIQWVPNFSQAEIKSPCERTEEYVKLKAEMTALENEARDHELQANTARDKIRQLRRTHWLPND